ncbi:immune inhibitor A domain-containing protein [Nocardioides sp. GY 10127]|uniref:immune inhibitor A domain-containing protein n=1 Tax=Nocardioides sp. GY 10127 TaxID=2569762 RepID=UPI001F0E2DB1|nr:immune inhibitor A domain-containing protein [Nocardioides sp. GY 10127]
MRTTPRSVLGAGVAALAVTLPLTLGSLPAQAAPTATGAPPSEGAGAAHRPDDRPGPLAKEQQRKRAKALEMLANGSARLRAQSDGGATVQLAAGDYVEFPVEKTDTVWTILSEFGDSGSGRLGRTPGPLHNEIPEPDRSTDNSTAWRADFDLAYYDDLFNGSGESFKNYYEQLSSGRYSTDSVVEDWVQVPGNASTYGDNAVEDDGGAWQFIADTVDAWYAQQKADGVTDAAIAAHLASLDQWDRYDYDGDGDFNEPDGYIDHFQAVHAGEGEEAGADPDAIWSHRWYVNATDVGTTGPTVDGTPNLLGGTEIGDSGVYIGDYTVEPENGGLGVFAHEYGHDLGLPDYYDTAGGDNSTGFWTLMSSGSWLGHGGADEGIGTTPGLMGPQEKYFLGWLDHTEVSPGESVTVDLGPSQHTYDGLDQAVKVDLPDKSTTTQYVTPPSGTHEWWSGRGDNLSNTLAHAVPAASRVTVKASLWHAIEAGYDYLYGEYSLDGGATWTRIGSGIDGDSSRWSTQRWAYRPQGQASLFRFRYATDGGVNEAGAFLDDITISAGSTVVVSDGAENGTGEWVAKGWTISTGSETVQTPRYYLMENRQYVGYDATLEQGPYNFSELYSRPNWVEHFAYQPGLLVWYVDLSQADNNTSAHPGSGYALPVDARPAPFTFPDGSKPSNRRQPLDAAFGLTPVPQTCLHKETSAGQSVAACSPAGPGIATFDDSDPDAYYDATNPQGSVRVAGLGVTATVTGQDGDVLTVHVVDPAS